ncbi:ABC transporter ATP-binding protein [Tepidiphilus margaritifer]|uniref:ABC transporter ATP-binding protein n=1 Tax=Tepidiphilus margaritifer TaxID=203471 RepID=UPI00048AD80A|nr:ABC transporter ATP-binding protein [Tepidiphilus margaritifer]
MDASTPQTTKPILCAENLRKVIPNGDEAPLVILDGVDLTVFAGEAVAIVGASGSGKSTLLGLLAGLDVPSEGTVLLQGSPLFSLDEDERAALRGRLIGFVFQNFQLLPTLTALENVMLPLELGGVDDAGQRSREWLDRVGLSHRVHHYPRTLSGGEQQRVALARAFVTSPKVILADEPTGNLDTATGEAVIELMFSLREREGTTLVLVTHDASLARRCDRILKMHAGRLVQ